MGLSSLAEHSDGAEYPQENVIPVFPVDTIRIRMAHVSFRYGEQDNILDGVEAEISQGEMVPLWLEFPSGDPTLHCSNVCKLYRWWLGPLRRHP